MVSVDLSPETPFPKEEFKDLIVRRNDESPRLLGLNVSFSNAGTRSMGRITASIISKDVAHINVEYQIHENGGRGRFLSDISCLINLLVETGGFHVCHCFIPSSNCCANLIPDAINMLYTASKMFDNTSMECQQGALYLTDFDGALDPNVAAKTVANWKFGPHSTCVFYSKDISRKWKVLEAIFTNRNIDNVKVASCSFSHPIEDDALGLLSSLLSSPVSAVQTLTLKNVSAGAEADKRLATMLESNKSLTHLHVGFNSDSWIATEMSHVMRDSNCTLKDRIWVFPKPAEGSTSHTCLAEMQLYVDLNKHGRASMRSTTFRPEKIPILLEKAASAEGSSFGRFLYPLLRENPSSWTSYYLARGAGRQELESQSRNTTDKRQLD